MMPISGDLLLFKPKIGDIVGDIITTVTHNEYCHVAISMGDRRLIEMGPNGSAMRDIRDDEVIDVYRMSLVRPEIKETVPALLYEQYLFVKSAIELHESGSHYSYIDCAREAVIENLEGILPILEETPLFAPSDHILNCSGFCALAFRTAFDCDLVDGIPPHNLTPGDVKDSKHFNFCFNLQNNGKWI